MSFHTIKCFFSCYALAGILSQWFEETMKWKWSFPFLDIFFFLIFYLLNEFPLDCIFFFLKCFSVWFCIPFLWLSLSFLHYFIFPPWFHLPYNLHAATCPALSRTCSQPAIQQTRAGPACSHTPVETGKETDYNALHPTPAISGVFFSQSFSSMLSESLILNDFQWIKSTSPFGDDACFNVSKLLNQMFPALLC